MTCREWHAAYCAWVNGWGCMSTVPGQAGEDLLNGRITLEMCVRDSKPDDTGCKTKESTPPLPSPSTLNRPHASISHVCPGGLFPADVCAPCSAHSRRVARRWHPPAAQNPGRSRLTNPAGAAVVPTCSCGSRGAHGGPSWSLKHGHACAVHQWCEDHEFLDTPGHFACVPLGAKYPSAELFLEALEGYSKCTAQTKASCAGFRKYLFTYFECPDCAESANIAAAGEALCRSKATKEECVGISEPRYPQPNGAPAPAPVVARPSDSAGACPCRSTPVPDLWCVLCDRGGIGAACVAAPAQTPCGTNRHAGISVCPRRPVHLPLVVLVLRVLRAVADEARLTLTSQCMPLCSHSGWC